MGAINGGAESKIVDPGVAAGARMFSLEYAQLLTQGKNLETEIVAGPD
jgi:hypothetical protein